MKATTIKVEGDLLNELKRTCPSAQSLSAFVRSILRQELGRRRLGDAADRYAEFLTASARCPDGHRRATPEERAWLDEWDRADLAGAPKRRRA